MSPEPHFARRKSTVVIAAKVDAVLSLGAAMRRRDFIKGIASSAAAPFAACWQQTSMPVIGFFNSESPPAILRQLEKLL